MTLDRRLTHPQPATQAGPSLRLRRSRMRDWPLLRDMFREALPVVPQAVIDEVLRDATRQLVIACRPDDDRAHGHAPGKVVGFFRLSYRAESLAWLDYLVVRAADRNQGLGRALVAQAESQALTQGCQRMGLAVLVDNHGAQALYERLGYARISSAEPGIEGLKYRYECALTLAPTATTTAPPHPPALRPRAVRLLRRLLWWLRFEALRGGAGASRSAPRRS